MTVRSTAAQRFYSAHVRPSSEENDEPRIIQDVFAWLRRAGVCDDEVAHIAGVVVETIAREHHEHAACDAVAWRLAPHAPALLRAERAAVPALAQFLTEWTADDEAFLDVRCGNGLLLADELFDGDECVQFDETDIRARFARGPGLTFYADWADVRRDAEANGDFDVAFLINALRRAHTPYNEVARLRTVARRLVVVEAVALSEIRPRPTRALAVIDWLRLRALAPSRPFEHHARYQPLESWRSVLCRAGARMVTERAVPDAALSVPGDHRLFVCDFL